jgi:uroporphyrinogen-III synthase
MRIAVTRPEEDAGPLKARLEALGHSVTLVPLLVIRRHDNVVVPERRWQAIAVTSANAVRALRGNAGLRSIRMLTVGPQSLHAARLAGFTAEAHGGDVGGLAAYIREHLDPAGGPILYLSGAETAGDLEAQLAAGGFSCHRLVLYDAVPAATLGVAAGAIAGGEIDAVLLYSPRTAKIWRALIEARHLDAAAARVLHLCLSRNVAAVLPEAWPRRIAASPHEAAVLALLEQTG